MVTFYCLDSDGNKIGAVSIGSAGFNDSCFVLYEFTEEDLVEGIATCRSKIIDLCDFSKRIYERTGICDGQASFMRTDSRSLMFGYTSVLSSFCILLGQFKNINVAKVIRKRCYRKPDKNENDCPRFLS